MTGTRTTPARRRGRPPNSQGLETAARLVEAAAITCAEDGFDGATVSKIARRAGLTPTAIYNHFESREELLYAAGVARLQQVTAVLPAEAGADAARLIALSYLRPELAQTRRLLAELHLAGSRDPRLAKLLAAWHRSWAEALAAVLPAGGPDPEATVKALFMVLLGLCHLDHLSAVEADAESLANRVLAVVDALVPRRS
jgi:AcrR family transcriptional regulator